MTWSLLAHDADGAFGVDIASRFFAVGVLCPRARSGVGALSTQALVNPLYAEPGLALLAQGTPPSEVVRLLTQQDAGTLIMSDAELMSVLYMTCRPASLWVALPCQALPPPS